MKNKRLIWMLIGCILPLLLIFFAPALGLSSNVSLLIFIVAMFACHLFMPHGHGQHDHSPNQKEERYERHSH